MDHGPSCLYEALRNQNIINLSSLLNSVYTTKDVDVDCSFLQISSPHSYHLFLGAKWLETLGIPGSRTKSPTQKEPPEVDTLLPHTLGFHEWIMEFSASFPTKIVSNHSEQQSEWLQFWLLQSSQEEKEDDHWWLLQSRHLSLCLSIPGLDHLVPWPGPHSLGSGTASTFCRM